MTIFFIPFGGGNEFSYCSFKSKLIANSIEMVNLSLPGRGSRSNENLQTRLDLLVDDVYSQISLYLFENYKNDNFGEFSIFGHSLGGLLAFKVALKIKENLKTKPKSLFISGRMAPHLTTNKEDLLSDLPSEQFWQKLYNLGGIPEEILNEQSLLSFFEPILRSDLKISETYNYEKDIDIPLEIPLVVLHGSSESFSYNDSLAWQNYSMNNFKITQIEGGHFFIFDKIDEVVKIIVECS